MSRAETIKRIKERTAARREAGLIGKYEPSSPKTRTAQIPCAYRGEELAGSERQEKGLGHLKRWYPCEHPERIELKIAEYVCPCLGCNPTCPGYRKDQDTQ